MTPSIIEIQPDADDRHVARMAAFAVGLSVAEAALPSPLPGVKPGLANIVTLLVLQRYGLKTAIWVSLLRVLATSLLLGNFLAPGFVLSLGGALASLAALALARRLPAGWFGPISWSIVAAFAHMAAQLGIVYAWLIPHGGILYLLPVFGGAALLFGAVNGLLAAQLIRNPSQNKKSLPDVQHPATPDKILLNTNLIS